LFRAAVEAAVSGGVERAEHPVEERPAIRAIIDDVRRDLGDEVQIIVGGGVFNRIEGLAEEMGMDASCFDPIEVIDVLVYRPELRADPLNRRARRNSGGRQAA
jgi:nitrogenase molybdenum-iron protein alpha/beta subunit